MQSWLPSPSDDNNFICGSKSNGRMNLERKKMWTEAGKIAFYVLSYHVLGLWKMIILDSWYPSWNFNRAQALMFGAMVKNMLCFTTTYPVACVHRDNSWLYQFKKYKLRNRKYYGQEKWLMNFYWQWITLLLQWMHVVQFSDAIA
jgi:hypothetical protein